MSLFVGNLSRNVRYDELQEAFGGCGPCKIQKKVSHLSKQFNGDAWYRKLIDQTFLWNDMIWVLVTRFHPFLLHSISAALLFLWLYFAFESQPGFVQYELQGPFPFLVILHRARSILKKQSKSSCFQCKEEHQFAGQAFKQLRSWPLNVLHLFLIRRKRLPSASSHAPFMIHFIGYAFFDVYEAEGFTCKILNTLWTIFLKYSKLSIDSITNSPNAFDLIIAPIRPWTCNINAFESWHWWFKPWILRAALTWPRAKHLKSQAHSLSTDTTATHAITLPWGLQKIYAPNPFRFNQTTHHQLIKRTSTFLCHIHSSRAAFAPFATAIFNSSDHRSIQPIAWSKPSFSLSLI